MTFELVSSVVFFCAVTAVCAWFLYRARHWAAFWRNRQPVMLQAVSQTELHHYTLEEGQREVSITQCLTYKALDGPMQGVVHQSAVTTEPAIMKIGETAEGYCDPDLKRMESKKALWIIYGVLASIALVLGFVWLQSLRWILFETFTRGVL